MSSSLYLNGASCAPRGNSFTNRLPNMHFAIIVNKYVFNPFLAIELTVASIVSSDIESTLWLFVERRAVSVHTIF